MTEKIHAYIYSVLLRSKVFRFLFLIPLLKLARESLYSIFNAFYLLRCAPKFYSKIKKISKNKQIFVITRYDFGTFINTLHYISCWERQRGKTCLVVLTEQSFQVRALAKLLSPHTELIYPKIILSKLFFTLFGQSLVHNQTVMSIYARLLIELPNVLYIYRQASIGKDGGPTSDFNIFFDATRSALGKSFSQDYCLAYEDVRKIFDYRLDVYIDSINLHYNSDLTKPLLSFPEQLGTLKKRLGIHDAYIVFNINLKQYDVGSTERKRIIYPERYNCLIDSLIEKGYTVVIQGRGEQPLLQARKGLIDYSRTAHVSIENDILLYSGCACAILSKSGPENFTLACNVPVLGLNYVELPSMQANLKMRYYPKHLRNPKTGHILPWKELLESPSYFDVGSKSYQNMEYVDLEEEEMMAALKEFLSLISLPPEGWLNYTETQKEFKNRLHPMHLDLYYVKSVPSDAYLTNSKSGGGC